MIVRRTSLGLVACLVAVLPAAASVTIEQPSLLQLQRTWSIGSQLGSVTYNPVDGFAYLGVRSGAVDRLNPDQTRTNIGQSSGNDVAGIAVDFVTGDVYVTNDFEGRVTRFDASNNFAASVVLSNIIPDEDDTAGIYILPTTYTGTLAAPGQGLVTDRNNAGNDYLLSFTNPAEPTNTHTTTTLAISNVQPAVNPAGFPTPNGRDSTWVDVTASNTAVYLADEGEESANDVGQIYLVQDSGDFVPLLDDDSPINRPRGIATTLAGEVLYVADRGTGSASNNGGLYAVDPLTGDETLLASSLDFPFWGSVAVDPEGTRLWVVETGSVYEFAIIPEPTTATLFALSLALGLRRRRGA